MADYFDSAQEEINRQRRAALDAVASAGMAGKAAHEQEIARIQASKQQAIQGALASAAQRGAPAALNDQLSQQIGGGYDRQAENLQSSMASRSAGSEQMRAANESYFGQAAAAIPMVKARADRQLEAIRAKAAQEEEEREMRLMLSQMQLQRAGLDYETAAERASASREDRATKAAEKAAEATKPSKVISNLGGLGTVRNIVSDQSRAQAADFSERRGANGPGSTPRSLPSIANERGRALELPAPMGAGLLKPAAAKAPRPGQILQDQNAQAQLDARAARLRLIDTAKRAASPGTFFELEKAIDAGEEAQDISAALAYVGSLKDDYLKRNAISRSALLDWIKRYGAI